MNSVKCFLLLLSLATISKGQNLDSLLRSGDWLLAHKTAGDYFENYGGQGYRFMGDNWVEVNGLPYQYRYSLYFDSLTISINRDYLNLFEQEDQSYINRSAAYRIIRINERVLDLAEYNPYEKKLDTFYYYRLEHKPPFYKTFDKIVLTYTYCYNGCFYDSLVLDRTGRVAIKTTSDDFSGEVKIATRRLKLPLPVSNVAFEKGFETDNSILDSTLQTDEADLHEATYTLFFYSADTLLNKVHLSEHGEHYRLRWFVRFILSLVRNKKYMDLVDKNLSH